MHTEHSPGEITSSFTNQVLVNLRKLKSYQASLLTTMLRLEISKKNKLQKKKNTNTWKLRTTLLNNQEITKRNIKEEIKKT